MARDSNLTDDLEALAEEERQGLGDPPSIEQLIALRDGELPEDEAERFRDRIAVDPESATVYLELKRSADLEPAGETAAAVSPAAVDDAWEKLAPSLRADAPGSARPEGNAYRVLPFPRRGWWGRVFGVAAVLALAVGLVWLLTERGPRSQPDGDYHEVSITQAELRDNRLEVPEEAPGITFQIDAPALDASGEVVVELLDSSGRVIRRQEVAIEAGQRQLDFDVASRSLEEGRSYRLVVRRIDASTADRPWIDVVFAPVFVPAPKTGGMPAPDTCEAIDKQVSVTAERRQAGDRRAAEESYNDLLERSRTHGCPVQEARIWSGLATPVILEGRLLEGLRLLERADDVLSSPAAKAATDFEDEANWAKAAIELSRGTAYSRLGWLPDARQALAEARALYRRDGTDARRWARVLLQLARVYRLEGDVDEARETIREAQGWARETEDWKLRAAVWQESARLDIESGRLDAAERALDRAVAAIEKADELARANVLADVAELRARQGRWAESLRLVEAALDLEKPDLNLEAHARHVCSVAWFGLGDLDDAWRWRFMSAIMGLREGFPQHTYDRCAMHEAFTLNVGALDVGNDQFDGLINIGDGGSLTVNNTANQWTNGGTIHLMGGTLAGETVDNIDLITGFGLITARVLNNGEIEAMGGQLTINSSAAPDIDGTGSPEMGVLSAVDGNLRVVNALGSYAFDGTINVGAARAMLFDSINMFNNGTINMTGGTLILDQLNQNGQMNVNSAISTVQADIVNFGGASNTVINSTLAVGGDTTIASTAVMTGAGTLRNNGDLFGAFNIAVNVDNRGEFNPGTSVGVADIDGDYFNRGGSTMHFEIEGLALNQFDRVNITGQAALDGKLAVVLGGGFTPDWGDSWSIINYGSVVDDFAVFSFDSLADPLLRWWHEATPDSYDIGVRHVADVNRDNVINFEDLNLVVSFFNMTGMGLPGDADEDGDVDFEDLNLVVSFFNTFAPANVPAPGGATLLAISLLVGLRRRRD